MVNRWSPIGPRRTEPRSGGPGKSQAKQKTWSSANHPCMFHNLCLHLGDYLKGMVFSGSVTWVIHVAQSSRSRWSICPRICPRQLSAAFIHLGFRNFRPGQDRLLNPFFRLHGAGNSHLQGYEVPGVQPSLMCHFEVTKGALLQGPLGHWMGKKTEVTLKKLAVVLGI